MDHMLFLGDKYRSFQYVKWLHMNLLEETVILDSPLHYCMFFEVSVNLQRAMKLIQNVIIGYIARLFFKI